MRGAYLHLGAAALLMASTSHLGDVTRLARPRARIPLCEQRKKTH